MSISRIVIFAIGVVLAVFGLFLIVQHYNDLVTLAIGIILVIVGVVLLSGRAVTL